MWVDSHVHLVSDELFEDFEVLCEAMQEHDVDKALIICGNLKEIHRALDKVENNPMFDLAIGVHPSSAKEISAKERQEMYTYLSHPKVVAMGEIGLDYYWDQSFNDLQKEVLIEQIHLANEHGLPISVHMRDSGEDVAEILQKYPVDCKGVIHSFSEEKLTQTFLQMGYYIGINGIVTFKNGENVRRILDAVPLDRILSETDAPYLTPHPHRGQRNQPAYVSFVGQKIAELKGVSESDMQKILKENYHRVFTNR